MQPFEYYNTPKAIYPSKLDYTTVFVYDNGNVVWQGSKRDFKTNDFPKNAVVQHILNEKDYSAHIKEYNKELCALHNEFQNDLFEEFDVADNPKAKLCYSKAYEMGHAYGFSEVYSVFEDLVELIK